MVPTLPTAALHPDLVVLQTHAAEGMQTTWTLVGGTSDSGSAKEKYGGEEEHFETRASAAAKAKAAGSKRPRETTLAGASTAAPARTPPRVAHPPAGSRVLPKPAGPLVAQLPPESGDHPALDNSAVTRKRRRGRSPCGSSGLRQPPAPEVVTVTSSSEDETHSTPKEQALPSGAIASREARSGAFLQGTPNGDATFRSVWQNPALADWRRRIAAKLSRPVAEATATVQRGRVLLTCQFLLAFRLVPQL